MDKRQAEDRRAEVTESGEATEFHPERARWFLGGGMAASFASLLTIIGTQAMDHPLRCLAVILFALALPILGKCLFMGVLFSSECKVTVVTLIFAALGMLYFVLGFACLLEATIPWLGVSWFVLAFLMGWLVHRSEKRASRSKRAQTDDADDKTSAASRV